MRPSPFQKIGERKLVQWGLAYLGGAWLLLQVVDVLGDTYAWPSGFLRAVPIVLGVGFIATLVVAWYHGERGAQRMTGLELTILGTLLLIAGLGVRLVAGERQPVGDSGAVGPVTTAPSPEVREIAIAVLPFETIGGDEVLAAGLTDELHQTLSRVPTLRVTARTSARAVEGAEIAADSIGRSLGVSHLVEGTVRGLGDRVRVAARLVATESGLQEWSETYDRDAADLLAVQEEIARAVGYQLRVEVGSAALIGSAAPDPRVFNPVVRARQLLQRGAEDWGPLLSEARGLYEQAIARDSTYAPAWAGLATVRVSSVIGDFASDDDAAIALATADARRALALDPNEGTAHSVLGQLAHRRGDYEEARAHFERAVRSNPADTEALARLATTRLNLGDEPGALRAAERAATLDPLNTSALYSAAYVYSASGRHEEAVALGRAMLALVPYNPGTVAGLANFLAAAGQAEEAIALATRAVEAAPHWQHARHILAFAHAQAGDRSEAERVLDGASEEVHTIRAAIESALGDRDAAFAALNRSISAGEPTAHQIHTDNWLRSLHDDPRWDPLVEQVRLEARAPRDGSTPQI